MSPSSSRRAGPFRSCGERDREAAGGGIVMYMGGAAPSPAGPAEPGEDLRDTPAIDLPRALQVMRFTQRQIEFVFRARRELGEVFHMEAGIAGGTVVSSHPDHVRSLFTAKPEH